MSGYKNYQQFDLKGHVGVTEVKKVIFMENATSPTCFVGFLTKLGQNNQRACGYKNYQQFDLKGHVGVTGVKNVNHVKNMKTAPIQNLMVSSCRQ